MAMPYAVEWIPQARRQYLYWQRHEPRVAEKIDELMEAVKLDPFHGIGKPKHLSGFWSRRITEEHRLLYEVVGDQVNVLGCYGHYD